LLPTTNQVDLQLSLIKVNWCFVSTKNCFQVHCKFFAPSMNFFN
jgi:hypothetical protein